MLLCFELLMYELQQTTIPPELSLEQKSHPFIVFIELLQWKMTFKFGHSEILEFILRFAAEFCGFCGTQENTLNPLTRF